MTCFVFLGSKINVDGDCSHDIKICLLLGRKAMTNLDNVSKTDISLLKRVLCSQSCGFSYSYVQMWELDHKGGWMPKNWYFQMVMLEKTLESPLDYKDMKPVNLKGNKPFHIHWKNWCWSWSSNTLATWCKDPTHWKTPWCWERLKRKDEGGRSGWDG